MANEENISIHPSGLPEDVEQRLNQSLESGDTWRGPVGNATSPSEVTNAVRRALLEDLQRMGVPIPSGLGFGLSGVTEEEPVRPPEVETIIFNPQTQEVLEQFGAGREQIVKLPVRPSADGRNVRPRIRRDTPRPRSA